MDLPAAGLPPNGDKRSLPFRARLLAGLSQGLTSAAAALIAYLPANSLGLQEGFWGSITAIAVVQTEFDAARTSGRDQFAGAAVGGLIGALMVTGFGQSLVAYALAVIAAMASCWALGIPTAARLAGITSTIIALVPHHATVERMMFSRVAEVGWGVAVAISVVWIVNRWLGRQMHLS
jgi:uncharacterized membrane protein YccC